MSRNNTNPTDLDVHKILKLILQMKEGDVLKHEVLEKILGYGPPQPQDMRYYKVLGDAKLLAYTQFDKYLVSVRGKGYKLTNPEERLRDADKFRRRGINNIFRGLDLSNTTDPSRIGPQAKKWRNANIKDSSKVISYFTKPIYRSRF